MFLSLDGIDGAGKTTQSRWLADWLRERGHEVVTCADPGGTAVGAQLRNLLLDHRQHLSLICEALLFMASRAQLISEVIRPSLAAGKIVLSDRFLLANVVYQGYGGGLDPGELYRLGLFAAGGLEPDLTLVLDLPTDLAFRRRKGSPDRFENRDQAYFERLRIGFRKEAEARPGRIVVIDASRDPEEVQEHIRREVARVVDPHSGT